MKDILILGLTVIGFLVNSCNAKISIEEKLLNDIIPELTQPAREFVLPPNKNTDTVTLIVNDTLVRPVDFYLEITKKIYQDEVSEDYYNLLERYRSGEYRSTIIDISKIQGTETLKIISDNQTESLDGTIGILSLSPILLSENKKYGTFLSRFGCKGDCGFSEMIFVENLDGKWKIVNRIGLAIS